MTITPTLAISVIGSSLCSKSSNATWRPASCKTIHVGEVAVARQALGRDAVISAERHSGTRAKLADKRGVAAQHEREDLGEPILAGHRAPFDGLEQQGRRVRY